MAYNTFEQCGVGGEQLGEPHITDIGVLVPANYNYLAVGFINMAAGSVFSSVETQCIVSNGILIESSPKQANGHIAPYMYPAIFWFPSAAGIIANVGTPRVTLKTRLKNMYQRRQPMTAALDFT
jgi:hypothetical protein